MLSHASIAGTVTLPGLLSSYTSNGSSVATLHVPPAGDRYVVVDCGGGTVDLTVHQIRLPEGHLKELYKASGRRTRLRHTADVTSFMSYFHEYSAS